MSKVSFAFGAEFCLSIDLATAQTLELRVAGEADSSRCPSVESLVRSLGEGISIVTKLIQTEA
jgi:hypothetical protein